MVAENECNRLKTVHFVHNAIKLTAVGKRQLFACELLPLPFLHVVNRSQRSLCRHVRGGGGKGAGVRQRVVMHWR